MARRRGPAIVQAHAAHPSQTGDGRHEPSPLLPPSAIVTSSTRDHSTRHHGSSYETPSNEPSVDRANYDTTNLDSLPYLGIETHTSSYGPDPTEDECVGDHFCMDGPQCPGLLSGMGLSQTLTAEDFTLACYQNPFAVQTDPYLPGVGQQCFAASTPTPEFMQVDGQATPVALTRTAQAWSAHFEPSSHEDHPVRTWDLSYRPNPENEPARIPGFARSSHAYLQYSEWDSAIGCGNSKCPVETEYEGGYYNKKNSSRVRHHYLFHTARSTLSKEGKLDCCPICDVFSSSDYPERVDAHIKHHAGVGVADLRRQVLAHREEMKTVRLAKSSWRNLYRKSIKSMETKGYTEDLRRPTTGPFAALPSLSYSLTTRSPTYSSRPGPIYFRPDDSRKLPEIVHFVEQNGVDGSDSSSNSEVSEATYGNEGQDVVPVDRYHPDDVDGVGLARTDFSAGGRHEPKPGSRKHR